MNPFTEHALKGMAGMLRDRRTRMEIGHKVPDGVEELLDITFQTAEGTTLEMDVFRPKVPGPGSFPVVIMIHGGGLVAGNRKVSRYSVRT